MSSSRASNNVLGRVPILSPQLARARGSGSASCAPPWRHHRRSTAPSRIDRRALPIHEASARHPGFDAGATPRERARLGRGRAFPSRCRTLRRSARTAAGSSASAWVTPRSASSTRSSARGGTCRARAGTRRACAAWGRGRPRPSLAPRRRRAHGRRRDRRRPRRDARAQLHPAQRGLRQGSGPRGPACMDALRRARPRPPAMAGVPQQHRRLRRTSRRMGGRSSSARRCRPSRAGATRSWSGDDRPTPRHLPTRGDIRPGAEHTRHRGEVRGRGSDRRESQGEEREEVHVEVSRGRRGERAVRQHERERGDIIVIVIVIIIIFIFLLVVDGDLQRRRR